QFADHLVAGAPRHDVRDENGCALGEDRSNEKNTPLYEELAHLEHCREPERGEHVRQLATTSQRPHGQQKAEWHVQKELFGHFHYAKEVLRRAQDAKRDEVPVPQLNANIRQAESWLERTPHPPDEEQRVCGEQQYSAAPALNPGDNGTEKAPADQAADRNGYRMAGDGAQL